MVPPDRLRSSLDMIVDAQCFEEASREVIERWDHENVGVQAIEPTLKFMEDHPTIDYGSPGPLTHFIERFRRCGYEEALLASVRRSPTPHTIWLLNRLINGSFDDITRKAQIEVMRGVAVHQSAGGDARSSAVRFLKRLDG